VAAYTVVNGSDTQLVNINAGGTDVDAFSYKDGITLTNTELATLLDGASFGHKDVAVFADLTGDAAAVQKKRSAAISATHVST
jgi:hypothetical protein